MATCQELHVRYRGSALAIPTCPLYAAIFRADESRDEFLFFLRENARWLAGGFLLTFFSSFGQTFFISLSAGNIREEYGLSHGGFGTLYMAATLGSALTLPISDRSSTLQRAKSGHVHCPDACVGERLNGAIRRHRATRRHDLSAAAIRAGDDDPHCIYRHGALVFRSARTRGFGSHARSQCGRGGVPLIFVTFATWMGWRNSWLFAAALLPAALPAIVSLIASNVLRTSPIRLRGFRWTRLDARRSRARSRLLPASSWRHGAGFIATTIFFHQVYLVELRGWSIEIFASSFTVMALTTIGFALVSGHLIDRFSGVALFRDSFCRSPPPALFLAFSRHNGAPLPSWRCLVCRMAFHRRSSVRSGQKSMGSGILARSARLQLPSWSLPRRWGPASPVS